MSTVAKTPRPVRFTEDEWRTRVDLAALYRLFVHYGWTDLIYTHITARVPGEPSHYLINPYGLMFEEMTASNLMKVDFEGNVVDGDGPYNEAGHLIHTAVLKARPDVNFVAHTHSRAGTAVSAMKCGLLPISQHANLILSTVAYHDYALVTSAEEECEHLGRDLGDSFVMLLRNHGLLACGRTAGEAFHFLYDLEMACKIQVDVLAGGTEYVTPSAEAIRGVQESGRPGPEPAGTMAWEALVRMLDRKDRSFRS